MTLSAKEFIDTVETSLGRKATPQEQRQLARMYSACLHLPVNEVPQGYGWRILSGNEFYNMWERTSLLAP